MQVVKLSIMHANCWAPGKNFVFLVCLSKATGQLHAINEPNKRGPYVLSDPDYDPTDGTLWHGMCTVAILHRICLVCDYS